MWLLTCSLVLHAHQLVYTIAAVQNVQQYIYRGEWGVKHNGNRSICLPTCSSVCPILQRDDLSSEQRKVLEVLERTFSCYITEDPAAVSLKEKLDEAEARLAQARNTMNLGYTDPATG